jgi:2-dehydro-3-deoxygluconokinase
VTTVHPTTAAVAAADATAAPALVTIGETMGLVAADEIGPLRNGHRMVLGFAGAESNVAIGVRRLGQRAAWVGRVGADLIGQLILRELRAEGIDTTRVSVDTDAPSGLMLKTRRTAATADVSYLRRGSAGSRLSPADVPVDLIVGAKVLHLTGITAAVSTSAREALFRAIDIASTAGVTISFDVNHRSTLWADDEASRVLREIISRCDLVFASENEAALVVPPEQPAAMAKSLAALGPRHVIIKQGEHGYTASISGDLLSGPAMRVPVVDPVGAGDAFVAGYLASWVEQMTPADALHTANLAGAFVVAVPGDWEGLPTRSELHAFANRTDAVSR